MISIIVPTMWKFPQFIGFVNDVAKHSLVGEIIIINNNPNETPSTEQFQSNKIKIHTHGKNIFVNPAWNYGALLAENQKLCFMNDDIIFDLKVFDRVYPFVVEENGPIGLSVNHCHEHFVDGMIRIEPFAPGKNTFGFAILFFQHKKSYRIIPHNIELYFGDNFIFDSATWERKPILLIKDIFYYSPYSVTCKTLGEINQIKFEQDKAAYRELIKSKGYDPKYWCPEHFRNE